MSSLSITPDTVANSGSYKQLLIFRRPVLTTEGTYRYRFEQSTNRSLHTSTVVSPSRGTHVTLANGRDATLHLVLGIASALFFILVHTVHLLDRSVIIVARNQHTREDKEMKDHIINKARECCSRCTIVGHCGWHSLCSGREHCDALCSLYLYQLAIHNVYTVGGSYCTSSCQSLPSR
jgi:hypothetical protein